MWWVLVALRVPVVDWTLREVFCTRRQTKGGNRRKLGVPKPSGDFIEHSELDQQGFCSDPSPAPVLCLFLGGAPICECNCPFTVETGLENRTRLLREQPCALFECCREAILGHVDANAHFKLVVNPPRDIPDLVADLETRLGGRRILPEFGPMDFEPQSLWALAESYDLGFGESWHLRGRSSHGNPVNECPTFGFFYLLGLLHGLEAGAFGTGRPHSFFERGVSACASLSRASHSFGGRFLPSIALKTA